MKKYKFFKLFFGLTILALGAVSCDPQEDKYVDLGAVPSAESIEYKVSADEADTSVVNFEVLNKGVTAVWFLKSLDGTKEDIIAQSKFSKTILKRGNYSCDIAIYNKAGMSERKSFTFFAKGLGLIDGFKADIAASDWVWDKENAGHIGNGAESAPAAEWWVGAPNSLDEKVYDDVLTFKSDMSYVLDAKGFVLCNEGAAPSFGVTGATASVIVPYTQPADQKWDIVEDAGTFYLTFTNGGFPSYIPADNWGSIKYEIITLDKTTLHIKAKLGWGAFFMRFVHK